MLPFLRLFKFRIRLQNRIVHRDRSYIRIRIEVAFGHHEGIHREIVDGRRGGTIDGFDLKNAFAVFQIGGAQKYPAELISGVERPMRLRIDWVLTGLAIDPPANWRD